MTVFIRVWPVLKSLPAMATWRSLASSQTRGEIDREVRRAVREGDPLLETRPGVHLRVRDLRVVLGEPRLERRDRLVSLARREVRLGRTAPDRDAAAAAVVLDEALDVSLKLFDHPGLGRCRLHVRPVQALHVLGIKNRLHWLYSRKLGLHLVEVLLLEHVGVGCSLVCVLGEDVPPAKRQVFHLGERDELFDERVVVRGALSEPDTTHLRDRADGRPKPLTCEHDPGDRRGRDSPHAGHQDSELAFTGSNLLRGGHQRWSSCTRGASDVRMPAGVAGETPARQGRTAGVGECRPDAISQRVTHLLDMGSDTPEAAARITQSVKSNWRAR